MALLYPWATREYLLWNMSIGQIMLYYHMGMEMKYPDPNRKTRGPLSRMNQRQLREKRDEMIRQGLIKDPKEKLREQYGAIDDTR